MRFAFGAFVLDRSEAALTCSGEPVPLAPKELELLHVLVSQAGHLIHKEALIRSVWPDTFVSDSSLLRNVSVLRRHLGHDCIRTVPKRGYVFVLPVERFENPLRTDNPTDPVEAGQLNDPAPLQTGDDYRLVTSAQEEFTTHDREVADPGGPHSPDAGRRRLLAVPKRRLGSAVAMVAAFLFLVTGVSLRGPHLPAAHGLGSSLQPSRAAALLRAAGAVQLFVLNQNEDSISVLNTLTNSVMSRVKVTGNPRGAAILPDGKTVYISLNGANSVVALDTRTRRITAVIPVGNNPVGIAANPRPPFVYAVNNYSNSISVIDARKNRVVRTVAVGSVPTEIAVSPDGTRAIVTNQSGGTVTMLDAVANRVLATIPVGSTPVGVAFTPDSQFAWVTLAGQDEVAVLDVSARKVIRRVSAGHGPVRVAISRDGKYALISDFFSNTLTVIQTASLQSVKKIAVGLNPVGLTLDAPGDFMFVANYSSNTVSVIDMRTMTVVSNIDVGKNPVEMAALPCFSIPCAPQQ